MTARIGKIGRRIPTYAHHLRACPALRITRALVLIVPATAASSDLRILRAAFAALEGRSE